MEHEAYEAVKVAKYIVNKCTADGEPISNLKLQRILYLLQKQYLKEENRVLFSDDIEAWQFGPVVPEVYYKYCGYGSIVIRQSYDVSINAFDMSRIDTLVERERNKELWGLGEEVYGSQSAWHEVYQDGLGSHKVIPTNMIKEEI